MSEKKKRGDKYDKKLKVNVPFHDAINILMTKAAKTTNEMTIELKDFDRHKIQLDGAKKITFTNVVIPIVEDITLYQFKVILSNVSAKEERSGIIHPYKQTHTATSNINKVIGKTDFDIMSGCDVLVQITDNHSIKKVDAILHYTLTNK